MDRQGWLCAACKKKQAASCCCCSGEETFLCQECVGTHFAKNQFVIHANIPMKAYGQHNIPGYFDRLQRRLVHVPKAKVELFARLEAVDACMREFSIKIERMVEMLLDYSGATLSKLQKVREHLEWEINASIHEVENTMHDDNPKLICKLSRYLRDFGHNPKDLKLFSYRLNENPFPPSLESILQIAFDLCPEEIMIRTPILAAVYWDKCNLHDLPFHEPKYRFLSKQFHKCAVFCLLDFRTVLCIGYKSKGVIFRKSKVYTLSLPECHLSLTSQMSTPRNYPGVIRSGAYVYVFGSYRPYLSSCERYDLFLKTWSCLKNMATERCCFSPCEFERKIYLLETKYSNKSIEIFDEEIEVFRTLSITPPSIHGYSVSFIVDGQFIILTEDGKMAKWQIQSSERCFSVSKLAHPSGTLLSNCPPLKVGRTMYWVYYYSGNLMKFNLDTNEIT